ncbi:hypothetical protein ACGFNU_33315 [Spirillospora sp. NPDC048911]|uniref:hypothetical protein n=1 Tax=Spirillospora sp. NPDC048911 TaxID=3364527 RepID=UPI0037243725
MPETAALMRLMDEVKPSLLPGLEGLPLHHGEPELPGSRPIAPAVHLTPSGAEVGAAFGAGASSADYATRFGALHLVTEVPMWADERVADQTETDVGYREVVATALAARHELIGMLEDALAAVANDLTVRSPFRSSTEATLQTFRTLTEQTESLTEDPGSVGGDGRVATVAERFDHRQAVHLFRLRLLGTFPRMLDAEISAGNPTPAIRSQHQVLTERFERWLAEAESLPSIEIRRSVAVQLGAVLVAATRTTGS